LRAEKVMARLPVEKTGITPKSDFITLTHKDKKVTVRFGNVTDSPEGGKVWRYVETSEKPDYTFIVRGERCLEICRNKVNWQMAATDMEDLPHRSMKKARKPLAKKPDPPKGSMEKPK
ncbi:hypothetical protein KJ865_17535, partial [Myxococcota bacterium]|nr:hypothetical protein [Myxococcota bacterium]